MHDVSVTLRQYVLHSIQLLLVILLQSTAVPTALLLPRGLAVTLYSANKEMGSTEESYSHAGCEPKDYYFMETYVKSLTESLTQQQFPEQGFFEDVDYDDAALQEMLETHIENMFITPSEKACLLVSRRRPCPKEREIRC